MDMSVDHKASSRSETDRIHAAGGWVHNGRLHGVLAVSRAFGDIEHKKMKWGATDDEGWNAATALVGPSNNILLAEPEIVVETCLVDDEFVIIACDGLWDVMSSQQAVNFVRRVLATSGGDASRAVHELVSLAVHDLSSPDNVSAVLIMVNQSRH